MRIYAGFIAILMAVGFGSFLPTPANAAPSYKTAERCADASGFTARAKRHPEYAHRKIFATPKELAYINRCVAAATAGTTGKARAQAPAKRGTLPYPSQYPLMSGDSGRWPRMTMTQQRRAMLFLKSGSTIQSSLQGD